MPSWPPFLENGIAGAEEGLDSRKSVFPLHDPPANTGGCLSGSKNQRSPTKMQIIGLHDKFFSKMLAGSLAIFGTTGTIVTAPSLSGKTTYPTSKFIPKSIFTKLQMRHISPSSAMASKHLGPHLSKDGGWHRTVRSAKGIGLFRRWQCKTGFFRFTLSLLGSIPAYPTW